MDARRRNENAAARAGATASDDTGQRTGGNDTPAKPFAVFCPRDDGRRRLFARYATRHEAEAVAKTLRNVGCEATAEAAP